MATAIPISIALRNLKVSVASGEALDVREFHVREGMSRLFEIDLQVVSPNADVDFEGIIGGPARFEIGVPSSVDGRTRAFAGVCTRIELVIVDADGLATYELRIAPRMWLATQRRTYRVFQDQSELDVALAVLSEWGITPRLALSPGNYEKRRYRVQYAESDFELVSRMLEDIGVAYYFEHEDDDTRLVLVDAPNRAAPRPSIRFVAEPNDRIRHEWVTDVHSLRRVRPGRYTQSDVDYRKPLDYALSASASAGDVEAGLERYHHNYGSFLWKGGGGGGTPVADDRGPARTNEGLGRSQVARRLDAQRVERRGCTWRTNAHDVRPGVVVSLVNHPRSEVAAPQLVVGSELRGSATGDFSHTCETRYADVDYRPELVTPKPRTLGVESATVTGPAGEEIHTDELGRVRLHFHWDRQGPADEQSSCWIPVSQPWAGAGFGAISLPRVGQEVLVDFLGEDPDRPVVLGRVFTTTTPPPYELPKYKMVSGLRSESYPKPKKVAGGGRMGGGPIAVGEAALAPLGGGPRRTTLGGGVGGGSDPLAGGLSKIMPGTFGGDQAPLAALEDTVTKMRSPGPDGADAGRSANGLVSDDGANDEKLYLQAQRDMRIVVKNDFVGAVGANRAFTVLGNDYEGIVGYQATKVGKDREVEVTGKMKHTVQKDILDDGKASRLHRTKTDYASKTEEGGHGFKSKAGHSLKVEASTIIVFPQTILIDSPKVYINPGRKAVDAAMNGQSVAELMANEQREDRIQRAMEAMARHDLASGFSSKVKQESLAATGRGANTPFSHAARSAGVTDSGEISEAARRMHDIMYVPS